MSDIDFRQTVSGGRALTMTTPRYREVSVRPTSDGGGVLGSVKRAVKKFVANAFAVHDRNPDENGNHPHRPDRAPVPPGKDVAPVPLVWPSGWTDGSAEGAVRLPITAPRRSALTLLTAPRSPDREA